jgi:hypothetical protein
MRLPLLMSMLWPTLRRMWRFMGHLMRRRRMVFRMLLSLGGYIERFGASCVGVVWEREGIGWRGEEEGDEEECC